MISKILLEFHGGTSIAQSFDIAEAVAVRLGTSVSFSFNGEEQEISPAESAAVKTERWFLQAHFRTRQAEEREKQRAQEATKPRLPILPAGQLQPVASAAQADATRQTPT